MDAQRVLNLTIKKVGVAVEMACLQSVGSTTQEVILQKLIFTVEKLQLYATFPLYNFHGDELQEYTVYAGVVLFLSLKLMLKSFVNFPMFLPVYSSQLSICDVY